MCRGEVGTRGSFRRLKRQLTVCYPLQSYFLLRLDLIDSRNRKLAPFISGMTTGTPTG